MFLIAGVNGSGKSTFTKTIIKKFPFLRVIDPDAIAKEMTGSFTTIDSKQLSAGRTALLNVQLCIERQEPFIVESTISGRTYLKYLKQAKESGFKTILIYVGLSNAETSVKRVKARVSEGGHHISIDDIQRRYPKSLQNLKSHIQLCDLVYIYDNSDHYKLVAGYRDNHLHRQIDIPAWLMKYLIK